MDVQPTPRRHNPSRTPAAARDSFVASAAGRASPKHHLAEQMPPPPPPLHSRAANESWDPQPNVEWNTPYSSPTKGSTAHLVELFDKQIQLAPSPSPRPRPTPSKRTLKTPVSDDGDTSVVRMDENSKAPKRTPKESAVLAAAARDAKKTTGPASRGYASGRTRQYDPFKDMSLEDLEKLSKPSVKRLKDVAHLCKLIGQLTQTLPVAD